MNIAAFKEKIFTADAPSPSGTYSQAIRSVNTIYISGQIGKISDADSVLPSDFKQQAEQVFKHLSVIASAAGGSLNHIVKLTIFLTDLSYFPLINTLMTELFAEPYPARSTIEVSRLPLDALIEIEAVMQL